MDVVQIEVLPGVVQKVDGRGAVCRFAEGSRLVSDHLMRVGRWTIGLREN